MDVYKKDEYSVYEYRFQSLDSFIEYILNGEINQRAFDAKHLSSLEGSYRFTKTKSLDEAIRLCKYGWNEDFDRLLSLKTAVDKKFLDSDTSVKRIKGYVGFAPSVPDYLRNNPKHMWKLHRVPNWNIVQIYVNISCPGFTSTTAIYNRGAIILSIVDALEKAGYAVKLTVFSGSYCDDEVILSYFNIKEESENLNLKKAYFPLCHASFFRRLVFRLREVTPVKRDWDGGGYGSTFRYQELTELLDLNADHSIIFTSPSEMGIEGDNLYEDLESTLKKIKFNQYLKLQ